MYGCELWSVDNAKKDKFSVSMRNGLRRVWTLPNFTLKALLHEVSEMLPTSDEICLGYPALFTLTCITAHF
jgi:hypothetical protein